MNRRDFLFKEGAATSLGLFASSASHRKVWATVQAPIPVTEFHPLRGHADILAVRDGLTALLVMTGAKN